MLMSYQLIWKKQNLFYLNLQTKEQDMISNFQ
jgi:hypothetical protein